MSKSDRSLIDMDSPSGSGPGIRGHKTVGGTGGQPTTVAATVLSARDHFMRRSSRTSFGEVEVT